MAGAQRAGVEKVPPLQHDKDGEEYGKLDVIHSRSLLKVPQQGKGNNKEQTSNGQDTLFHRTGNDEGIAGAWLLFHHLARRRQ